MLHMIDHLQKKRHEPTYLNLLCSKVYSIVENQSYPSIRPIILGTAKIGINDGIFLCKKLPTSNTFFTKISYLFKENCFMNPEELFEEMLAHFRIAFL